MKRTVSLLLSLLIICLFFCGCTYFFPYNRISDSIISKEDAGLAVHFVDVGQGDCVLLESRGQFAIIDAGEYSEKDKVISYLRSAGVKTLDYMISTHPHSDHCGGLSEVLRSFETAVFISPDVDSDSNSWEYVLDAADEQGVTYETPEPYDTYTLGDATITVLSPSSDAVYSSLNDYSVVCMVEYGSTSFLLTGDAEETVEKELVRSGYDLSADVLKCGHHGSSTSSCGEFLKAVSPSAAIISCGKDNDYGHPHKEVTETLNDLQIPIWRTDLSGNIIARSDGEKISISTTENDESVFVTAATPSQQATYIANKSSKVFHSFDCGSVDTMSKKNKVDFNTRNEALNAGYTPCGSCQP